MMSLTTLTASNGPIIIDYMITRIRIDRDTTIDLEEKGILTLHKQQASTSQLRSNDYCKDRNAHHIRRLWDEEWCLEEQRRNS